MGSIGGVAGGLLLAAELGWALLCIAQDLRTRRIGNRLVLAGLALALLAAVAGAWAGRWPEGQDLGGAVVAALALLPAWKLGVLGGGDVKLALVLAVLHPAELPLALVLGLVAALVAGLIRRALGRGPGRGADDRRRLPFAPFLLLPWLALRLLGAV